MFVARVCICFALFAVVVGSAVDALARPGGRPSAAPAAPAAGSEIEHVVQHGQYLSLIAKRYHTTAEAIRKNNGLAPATMLRPGMTLRIIETPEHRAWREHNQPRSPAAKPAARPDKDNDKEKDREKKDPRHLRKDADEEPPAASPRGAQPDVPQSTVNSDKFTRRPARSGFVTVTRLNDTFRGQLRAANGKLVPKSAEKLDWLLRAYKTNEQMRIDRRLVKLLGQVSDHFGGRQLIVVSGFRPYSTKQFTRNSRHNHGQAVDFRIAGVPNVALYEYCLTLPQTGCGFYPNSLFVHMDVRLLKTKWIDYSRPGQAPIYARKPAPVAPGAKKPADADKDDDGDDPEPGE
jgi:uncharacterized protein YcbK (DUF882 family)